MLLSVILLAAAAPQAAPDPEVGRMVAIFDELCLRAFPDDAAVDAVMAAKGATPLTPEQVRVTFPNDPGRGWLLADGERKSQIMLELPPYHACSIRRFVESGTTALDGYRALAAAYEQAHPGFAPIDPIDRDINGIRVHGTGETRVLPDGTAESLYLIDQHTTGDDGAERVEIRFVRQLHR